MRSSDWSSDVCSSDLLERAATVDAQVPSPHEVACDDPLVGQEHPDVVGRGALGDLDLADLTRAARGRDLSLDPEPGGRGGHHEHDEDAEHDDEGSTASRRSVAHLHVLVVVVVRVEVRSEEHTSELQSLMRISYAVFCLKQNKK